LGIQKKILTTLSTNKKFKFIFKEMVELFTNVKYFREVIFFISYINKILGVSTWVKTRKI